MKHMKQLIFIISFLALSSIVNAQVMVGPKLGVNIASQFKSDFTVPKLGLVYGGAVDIPIAKGISVQGEFLVTQKGYREQFNGKDIFDELIATYLEIPAAAKYTVEGINFGYYFMGGVYWSYWTKGKYQSSTDGNEIIFEDYPFQSDYGTDGYKDNRNDFGLIAEAGVTYDNLGSGLLTLGLRYSHGLVPTTNFQNPPQNKAAKINKLLTLSVTYFMFF
jgi:outer membrane protein with beta-barrel domain